MSGRLLSGRMQVQALPGVPKLINMADVAQRVERLAVAQEVVGSSPIVRPLVAARLPSCRGVHLQTLPG